MPLNTDHRITILDIALKLHCASTTLTKDPEAVLVSAEKFVAFAEAATAEVPVKPSRKAKDKDPPPVVAVEETATEHVAESPPATTEQKAQTPPPAAKAEPSKSETTAVTEADVKALVGKVATNAAAGGAPKAREILAKVGDGATNISTLKPEKYAAVHAALSKVLQDAEEAASIAA